MQQLTFYIPLQENKYYHKFIPGDSSHYFMIENRRFLGNKFKLLPFIKRVIEENCQNVETICDIFAGTGVVGFYLSTQNNKVIFNDILKSCTIPIKAFATVTQYDKGKIDNYINEFNRFKVERDNYFSINFGNKYFNSDVARKIGAIRDLIEKAKINEEEKSILLTSLLYTIDKIANTVGHYDAYTKTSNHNQEFKMRSLYIPVLTNQNNEVYEENANSLIKKLKGIDLLYIDPPYNSRQYSDTYHLLENLIRWEKPKVFGKAAKMDRSNLKSKYCLKSAGEALKALINNADCKYILLSYNNTENNRHQRSNNRIPKEEIINILKGRGRVEIFEQNYKEFTTGKAPPRNNHKEILYFCEVTD